VQTTGAVNGPSHALLPAFRHEAFFYSGPSDFGEGAGAFVEAALGAGEAVMVALLPEREQWLRERLGPLAAPVHVVDMAALGRNPARIIPAWRRFVDEHAGSAPVRAIAEPIWAAPSADELTECLRHESLLNTAFAGGRPWWLLCPYDVGSLPEAVLDEARRRHPYLAEGGTSFLNPAFDARPSVFDGSLPDPGTTAGELPFDGSSLRALRAAVAAWASTVLPPDRAAELVLVAHEIACNSVRHGGGRGTLRYWHDGAGTVVEVRDHGRLARPLVGRELPAADEETGRGLWLANQLCDLVQLRSSAQGTVVRVRVKR
jgi:anti-sigma regulatory factor (Ser/Thr protein kinase)